MPLAYKSMPRARLATLLLILAAASCPTPGEGNEPTPEKNYLKFIRGQAEALRAGEQPPATVAEWEAKAAVVRNGLQKAWGEFPAEPCPLEPQVLGTSTATAIASRRLSSRPGPASG